VTQHQTNGLPCTQNYQAITLVNLIVRRGNTFPAPTFIINPVNKGRGSFGASSGMSYRPVEGTLKGHAHLGFFSRAGGSFSSKTSGNTYTPVAVSVQLPTRKKT